METQVVSLPEEIASILLNMELQHLNPEWTIQETADNLQVNLKWRKQPSTTGSNVTIRPSSRKSRAKLERDRKRHDMYMQRKSLFRHHSESTSLSQRKVNAVSVGATCNDKTTLTSSDASCQSDSIPSIDAGTMTNETSFVSAESQTSPIKGETTTSVLQSTATAQPANVNPSSPRCTEKVLKRRVKNNRPEFLIKWQDLPSNKNTWVSEAKLDSFPIEYLKANEKLVPGPKPCEKSPYEAHVTYMQQHRARMRHVVHMRDNRGFHSFN